MGVWLGSALGDLSHGGGRIQYEYALLKLLLNVFMVGAGAVGATAICP